MMDLTLDAFMSQLGEASSANGEAAASGVLRTAEAVAQRAKKDYGLSVDAAQYILKDWACDITKQGEADAEKPTDRFVESYISTIAKDRDNEAILPEGVMMEDYRGLPIVLRSHLYSELGIGSNQWIIFNANAKAAVEQIHSLLARTQFASKKANPLADQLYNWSIEGLPIGDSIGFIPVDFVEPQDKGWDKVYDSWVKRNTEFLKSKGREATDAMLGGLKRIFTKVIMLEYSKVMIPSNPFAVSTAIEKGLLLESERESYTIKEPAEITEEDTIEDAAEIEWRDYVNDPEIKEGRTLSKKTLAAVNIAHTALGDLKAANAIDVDDTDTGKAIQAKEHWNPTYTKSLDIAEFDEANTAFRYSLYTKYLDCQVKEIYVNTYDIPSPLMGTYLEAIRVVTSDMTIDDTRRFSYRGEESPPTRSYIQLNSKQRKRYLVNGSEYCHDDGMALIKEFSPGWRGLEFALVTSTDNEAKSDEIMNAIHAEADANHMLKGEKFALGGEFLPETKDAWEDLVITAKDKQAITKSMTITQKADGNSRGLMFVGPPGTGKTKTGRTIMNDTDSTFIWVSARDFMYGMSSYILSLAFDMARKLAPTVLFMEDVDKSLDSDMLKTELDGLKQNKGLMTILTTNHPDRLPKALIDRPGRFHHILLFDLPDEGQRKDMFKLWVGDVDAKTMEVLVDSTEGFSGAHIYHLVDYSKTIAEDEEMSIGAALVESLLRMSDQIELVSGLSQTQTKELFNEEDLREKADEVEDGITPELAQWLLDQDDEERAEKDKPLTFEQMKHIATGGYL